MLRVPDALSAKVPEEPKEFDQNKVAKGVPVKLMIELDPGQILVDEVKLTVGDATTKIVPVALTLPQPPIKGIT
jgi:hypothetical protein